MDVEEKILDDNYYEIVSFIYKHKHFFCIWCNPEEGEPYFEKSGTSLLFENSEECIKNFLHKNNYKYEHVSQYNFDENDYSDCNDYLNKWNIIDDLSKTLEIDFIGNHDEYTDLYSKFVYGSNIPALNTSGKEYVPVFDTEEKSQIANVTKDMIRILKFALGMDS